MSRIKGVDHIAIAVEDLDRAIVVFETVLGSRVNHRETIEDQGVEVATIPLGDPGGSSTAVSAIELVAALSADSPIGKFIAKRGPGIHHIALAVGDIERAIAELKNNNITMIHDEPRTGKEGSRIAFVHPGSTEKVLLELVEPGESHESS